MSKLFIELLSEEIPYWLQKNIVEQFANRLTDVIINNNLSLIKKVNVNYNFTSQRLIFSCEKLIHILNVSENTLVLFRNKMIIQLFLFC